MWYSSPSLPEPKPPPRSGPIWLFRRSDRYSWDTIGMENKDQWDLYAAVCSSRGSPLSGAYILFSLEWNPAAVWRRGPERSFRFGRIPLKTLQSIPIIIIVDVLNGKFFNKTLRRSRYNKKCISSLFVSTVFIFFMKTNKLRLSFFDGKIFLYRDLFDPRYRILLVVICSRDVCLL